jgi:hypothetical protein
MCIPGRDLELRENVVNNQAAPPLDLLWGVNEISGAARRTKRQTYHLLESGALAGTGAKRVGGRWVVSRRRLVEFFEGEAVDA